MIVGRDGAAVTAAPDDTEYAADPVFGVGTGFDGGYVLYIGSSSPQTVTGLTNGHTYYYTFFTRNGTHWSSGVTVSALAFAPSAMQYHSAGSGNWSDISTWEVSYDYGSNWVAATTAPESANGMITVLAGDVVTVTADVAIDQAVVEATAQLNVATGVTLTVSEGADPVDLSVSGTLYNQGTVTAAGTLTFNSNGTYNHARDGGAIPTATWYVSSDCIISSVEETAPSNLTQGFGNFTWDCTSQTNYVNLGGTLTTVNGDFTVTGPTTGSNSVRLGHSESGDLTIGGNYTQDGGILTVTGGTATRNVTVKNDFTLTGGSINMNFAGAAGTLYVEGDFTHTAGTFTVGGGGYYGNLVFSGTGTQTYTSGGTVYNLNYTVDSGADLQMATPATQLTGGGSFTLSSGATLGISSAYGITATGTTVNPGNIAVSGTRTYDSGAGYVYNGTANQAAGDGLPAGVNDLTIANTGAASDNIVTLAGSTSVTGALTITSGVLDIGTYAVDAGTFDNSGAVAINSTGVDVSGSLFVSGTITQNGGSSVTYNRAIPDDGDPQLWHYVSSPVDPTVITSDKDFYPWDEVGGDWGSITTTILPGRGYTVIGSGSISYAGTLAEDDLTVPVTSPYADPFDGSTFEEYSARAFATGRDGTVNWGGGGWNLLGNPYTSALNVSGFIDENHDEVAPINSQFDPNYVALYLYNGDSYQYVAKSTGWTGGTYLDEDYIQAGQGFFVMANNNSSEFTFSRSMQGHDGAVLLKSARTGDTWPGLRLKAQYSDQESATLVVFNEDMTAGLDPGYDVGLMTAHPDIEIYTKLAAIDNSVNFARQALPMAHFNDNVIPVGINLPDGGEVTFSADVVPIRPLKFYLEDRVTGIFTDLGKNDYTVTLPLNTSGTGRFFLYTTSNVRRLNKPGVRNDRNQQLDLMIWAAGEQINIRGEVSDKAVCQIYNARGMKVMEVILTDGYQNTISVPSLRKGVYLVTVIDGNKMITKKVVIV